MALPTLAELGIGRLFDLVPDAVVVGDVPSGRVVAWNPAAELIFGYAASDALGMELERLVPPELRQAHLDGLARYAAGEGGHLTGSRELVELPALHADGHQFWVELRLAALDVASTSRRYVLAVFRDVTTRRQAQADAETALAQLSTANAALRDFVAMAAHDIRSPVAGVAMSLDLLGRKWDDLDDDQRRQLFDGARRHSTFVIGLLDDLVDVSSLESGSLATSPEPCDAAEVLAQAVELSGLPVGLEAPTGLMLLADRRHVQRVTVNLINNAGKHGRPPITVRARPLDEAVAVDVEDGGDGVADELVATMFDKFVRGVPGGAVKPGAGLGLAIVAGLMKANGGDISYERVPGGGSRFTCRWRIPPVAPGAPRPRAAGDR